MTTPTDKLTSDVTYLSKNMAVVGALVDRLDATLSKLTDISVHVSSLLAVHETKLTTQDFLNKQISDLVEVRRVETDVKIKSLDDKIVAGEKEIKEKIDDQYDELVTQIKAMREESTTQYNILSGRITAMEKWQWIVIGGSATVGSILAMVPWDKIF